MTVLRKIFNAVAANLPVIGPHAGIEAELLLAGLKPLGMVMVMDRPENPAAILQDIETRGKYEQKIFDDCLAADKDVAAGRLAHRRLPTSPGNTVHYYFRPGQESVVDQLMAWDNAELVEKQRGGVPLSDNARRVSMSMYELDKARDSQPAALLAGKIDVARVFRRDDAPRPDLAASRRNIEDWIKQCDDVEKLDAAVAAGRLVSADLVLPPPSAGLKPSILRHYCQPGQERQMEAVLRQNEEWIAKKSNVQLLDKDIGDYLGYRKKDIDLWYGSPQLQKLPFGLGPKLHNAAVWASRHFAQAAYHSHMVDKAQSIIKRQEKPAAPKR